MPRSDGEGMMDERRLVETVTDVEVKVAVKLVFGQTGQVRRLAT